MSTSVSTNILDNLKLEVETIIDNKNLSVDHRLTQICEALESKVDYYDLFCYILYMMCGTMLCVVRWSFCSFDAAKKMSSTDRTAAF